MPLSKAAEKRIRLLAQKKQRELQKKFIVEGEKMLLELLQQDTFLTDELWLTESFVERHHQQIHHSKWEYISDKELKKVSSHKSPQGGLAIVQKPSKTKLNKEKSLVLFLDDIQDPGNLGTLLRLADWFGLEQILCSPNTVDYLNPKVVQSSMGAVFRIAVIESDLAQAKRTLPDHLCLGATMTGKSMYKYDNSQKSILVIGNEGNGISEKNLDLTDQLIAIPRFGKSGAESLNAAVAGAILISQLMNSHNI